MLFRDLYFQSFSLVVLKMLYISPCFHLSSRKFHQILLQFFNYEVVIIYRTIMKYCRNFLGYFITQITYIMSCSSIFTCLMAMISYFIIFILSCIYNKFLAHYNVFFLLLFTVSFFSFRN